MSASDPSNQKINWLIDEDGPVPNEGNVDGYWKMWSSYHRYLKDEQWESVPSQAYLDAVRRVCSSSQCSSGVTSCDRKSCPPQACSEQQCSAGVTTCDRAQCAPPPGSCMTPTELEACTIYVPCFEVLALQYNGNSPCALWDRAQDELVQVLQPGHAYQINAEREKFHQYECYSQRSIEAKFGAGTPIDSPSVPNWRGSGLLADAYIPYEIAFYSRSECTDTVVSPEIFFFF
ncbi:MAG: hypothetical protein IAG13_09430 [Deltaproteobacteria bacterium]|nr:hypothetical protein [Nannocystaceae bacterium]